MNGARAKWLRDRIGYEDTPPGRKMYKIIKRWWKDLSHKERRKFANCEELQPVFNGERIDDEPLPTVQDTKK